MKTRQGKREIANLHAHNTGTKGGVCKTNHDRFLIHLRMKQRPQREHDQPNLSSTTKLPLKVPLFLVRAALLLRQVLHRTLISLQCQQLHTRHTCVSV